MYSPRRGKVRISLRDDAMRIGYIFNREVFQRLQLLSLLTLAFVHPGAAQEVGEESFCPSERIQAKASGRSTSLKGAISRASKTTYREASEQCKARDRRLRPRLYAQTIDLQYSRTLVGRSYRSAYDVNVGNEYCCDRIRIASK